MNDSHIAASADAVRKDYSARKQNLEAVAAASGRRSAWAFAACVASIVLLVLPFLFRIDVHGPIAAALPIPALVAIWQIRIFLRDRRRAIDAAHRAAFYERGIDRIDGGWPGKGNSGVDFARDHHLYQDDLDILGTGSLFELLATTRSDAGAERLAAYLLDPVIAPEARARQEAVKELQSAVSLREEIGILGEYRFQDCSRRRISAWFNKPVLRAPKSIPVLLALLSLLSLSLAVVGFMHLSSWASIAPLLALSLTGQGAISLAFMREVRTRIEVLRTLRSDVSVLRAGIGLIARLKLRSAKLSAITESLSVRDVGKTIHALERLLKAIECREDAILYSFLLWVAAGTQLILAVERWRMRYQDKFEQLLDAWGEFEALSALAGYAYEHPADTFPDLIDGSARFEAREMGHPLLSDRTCVTNDIALDDATRFYIVSGSNMAGKSTLLRAIGQNAILAAAGAPVRATQARIAVMTICASIAVGDSLSNGASKFFAEVERLHKSIAKARKGEMVLFLIDEMLAGTNSQDRRIAAGWMLDALIAAGAVGALSTHDLALTEIAQREGLRGTNVHMQSRSQDNPLDFDYRLWPGVASQTNALAIVRMMGLQV